MPFLARRFARLGLVAVLLPIATACSGSDVDGVSPAPEPTIGLIPTTTIADDPGMSSSDDRIDGPATTVETTTTTTLPPLPNVRLELPPGGGFAEAAGLTGGLDGEPVVVTTAADGGSGSYREALSSGQRHITFDASLDGAVIELESDVIVAGDDITLDGSGVDITITGGSTKFTGTNIVVAGMTFRDNRRKQDSDALTFLDASTDQVVGVYGSVFSRASDGLIDLIWNRGNDVDATICGNLFERHDKAMLINSGRSGREGGHYRVTLCHNRWVDVYQRTPLSRDSWVHQYNSVFERYGKADGAGGGSKAGGDDNTQHLLENNIAIPREVGEETFDGETVTAPRSEWAGPQLGDDGRVRITGSWLVTVDGVTATEEEQGRDEVFDPPYDYRLATADASLLDVIRATAGTCVPTDADTIVPCAPLTFLEPGEPIVAVVDGDVDHVVFVVGETELDATPVGGGRYEAVVDVEAGEAFAVRALAFVADGRSTASDVGLVGRLA